MRRSSFSSLVTESSVEDEVEDDLLVMRENFLLNVDDEWVAVDAWVPRRLGRKYERAGTDVVDSAGEED